jgi:RNA polymerase sigma-70 factor (ECF subfamily)
MSDAPTPLAQQPPPDGGPDFRKLMIELIPFLRAFARTLSRHASEADDLCQEALVRAWKSRASFEPGTNLKAWLFMILRNQFYTEKRRSWRRQPWDEAAAERTLVMHGSQESAAELSDVARAMRTLPAEQREALILVAAGEFTYEEAAKVCGCAVGTIKSRVARGRRALADTLSGGGRHAQLRRPENGQKEIMGELDRLSPSENLDTNRSLAPPSPTTRRAARVPASRKIA